MPLPVLETPTYELTVPSTKKKVKFRPFLVKEEKVLMIAQETKDQKTIINAMKDIIKACTFDKLEPDTLTMYDLEFIFLKLRAKSVGETVELQLPCEECDKRHPIEINVDNIKIKYPKKKLASTIKLNDEVGVNLRHAQIKDFDSFRTSDDAAVTDDMMSILRISIDSIFDSNQTYHHSEVTPKELDTFIESLSRKQVDQMVEYLENIPKVQEEISFKCDSCGKENIHVIEGTEAFFG